MPPTDEEKKIRALAHGVIQGAFGNDQSKKGMFNIFWNMYVNSDLAELMVRQALRFDKVRPNEYARIGRVMHRVIGVSYPKIIRDALEATTERLFMCDQADADSVIDVWGQLGLLAGTIPNWDASFERLYPLFVGNYMRAGMSSILHVYKNEGLSGTKSYFISFLDYALTGEKNYPRMVWDKGSPFGAILEQSSEGEAWKKTYISKWKRPQSRMIEEILREFLHGEPFEDDLYGRIRRPEWIEEIRNAKDPKELARYFEANKEIEKISVASRQKSGRALLEQYKELTTNSNVPGLARYHYQCFWHQILARVYQQKEWGKSQVSTLGLSNKADVVYLLFQNREVIGECLAPVPLAEASRLTKQDIGNMLGDEPPVHSYYLAHGPARIPISSQHPLPVAIMLPKQASSWSQKGFEVNQRTLDEWFRQVQWTTEAGLSGNSHVVGKVNEGSTMSKPIRHRSGQMYILQKIAGPESSPSVMLKPFSDLPKAA